MFMPETHTLPLNSTQEQSHNGAMKNTLPLVSIITPAFNEEAIISKNLARLSEYMEGLANRFRYEMVVVNDGSRDQTGRLADEYAAANPHVRVIHHKANRNLGGALMTGFKEAEGDYIIVMDLDLSYAPDHIERLLNRIEETSADVVVASPYMKGGKNTAVPFNRLVLSKVVNRFMRASAGTNIHTFTSMVRVYRKEFLKSLNLKSTTYSINPEILYKGQLLRARILEIPAHLDWSFQKEVGNTRTSNARIFKGIFQGLMTGFIFRPYAFFMLSGLVLMMVSFYMIGWIFVNTFTIMPQTHPAEWDYRFSEAVGEVFRVHPHAFFVGGITLIISLQFLGIGFLSLQSKRYFDELFHMGTSILKRIPQDTHHP